MIIFRNQLSKINKSQNVKPMKKSRFRLSGMALPALLIMILALAGIIGTQSCNKKSELPLNNVTVSGIFHGDTVLLNGTIPARISFSFDEQSDGSTVSGVRVLIIGNKKPFTKHKYRSKYTISHWEETSEGNTIIEGVCSLGSELGSISITGTICRNESFSYNVGGMVVQGKGNAKWMGEFIRPVGTKAVKSALTTDYIGSYTANLGSSGQDDCGGGTWYDFPASTLQLTITAQWADGFGGEVVSGYLLGNIPYIGDGQHNLVTDNSDSEVYGGMLTVTTDDNTYYCSQPNTWNPLQPFDGGDFESFYTIPPGICILVWSVDFGLSAKLGK